MIITIKLKTHFIVCLIILLINTWCIAQNKPSTFPTLQATSADSVQKHIKETKEHLKIILRNHAENHFYGIDIARKIELSAPFEWISTNCQPQEEPKGFLLIHGLYRTAYDMRDIATSLQKKYPCSIIKAPLLTGHGADINHFKEADSDNWLALTREFLKSFKYQTINNKPVNKIVIIGHSLGASLAILVENEPDIHGLNIEKLILFSPAIRSTKSFTLLNKFFIRSESVINKLNLGFSPTERHPFEIQGRGSNELINYLKTEKAITNINLTTPTLVITGSKDHIINLKKTYDYFCNSKHSHIQIHIYKGRQDNDTRTPNHCAKKISLVELTHHPETGNLIDTIGHLSLHISPKNPFYRVLYYHCIARQKEYKKRFQTLSECENFIRNAILYYESDIDKNRVNLPHNPLFESTMDAIVQFIDTDS